MKFKTLLIFFLFSSLIIAQDNYSKRVIFLWDVTYSMHGGYFGTNGDQQVEIAGQVHTITKYLKKYDIYDAAMDMLISYIDTYEGESVELVVIPFGSQVLGTWRTPATAEGKTALIQKIRNFCELSPNKVQSTHIAYALEHIQQKIITAECSNMLYLMTDGLESKETNKKFLDILNNWCLYSHERNVEGYYFALTDQAVNKDLKELLSKSCFDLTIGAPQPPTKPMCQIEFQDEVVLSAVDDKGKNFDIKYMIKSNALDKKATLHFYVEDNPYILLDCNVEILNNKDKIVLSPKFKDDVVNIPVESPVRIKVFYQKDAGDTSNLILLDSSFDIVLKNRKIKKMKITIID